MWLLVGLQVQGVVRGLALCPDQNGDWHARGRLEWLGPAGHGGHQTAGPKRRRGGPRRNIGGQLLAQVQTGIPGLVAGLEGPTPGGQRRRPGSMLLLLRGAASQRAPRGRLFCERLQGGGAAVRRLLRRDVLEPRPTMGRRARIR